MRATAARLTGHGQPLEVHVELAEPGEHEVVPQLAYNLAHARCPVLAIPPPALAHELAHSRLAWVLWHRPLTPEQILRDQPKPADETAGPRAATPVACASRSQGSVRPSV